MTAAVYPEGKDNLANAEIDIGVDTFKIVLLSSAYTYSAAHDAYDDLTGVLVVPVAVTGLTVTAGVWDFDNVTIAGLDTGETCASYVFYMDSGTASTSWLLAYKDSAAELPLAGVTGVDVLLTVNAAGFMTL